MNIFKEVQELQFPLNSYIVAGSGHLSALGLKDLHDIDIIVTQALFEKCAQEQWKKIKWTYPERLGQIFLRKGRIELYLDLGTPDFNPTFEELFSRSVIINNVRFVSLPDILQFKHAYLKNNPKHLNDIHLIQDYLNNLERLAKCSRM